MDAGKYKSEFEKLLKKTLFSYPFYDKSVADLISDAKSRDNQDFEFGLFRLGNKSQRSTVLNTGEPIETQEYPFYNLMDTNIPPIRIKLSSFQYPLFFVSSLFDKTEKIKSTFNYHTFSNYSEMYKEFDKYNDKTVLITSCWSVLTKFGTVVKAVNVVPVPENDFEIAQKIRECFIKERRSFILELIAKPKKYMNFFPVDDEIINKVATEYKRILIDELNKLDTFKLLDS